MKVVYCNIQFWLYYFFSIHVKIKFSKKKMSESNEKMSIEQWKTNFANHLIGIVMYDQKLSIKQDFYDRIMYLIIYVAFIIIMWRLMKS